MAGSTFGEVFRLVTFGESHGPMIGAVIDGLQPGLELDARDIQRELDRRKPGQSAITTQRQEDDIVEIVSGVFEGKTTGTPLALIIRNKDQRSQDYGQIKDLFRPGHAAYTFLKKYGIYDYRGGGRASGRETAMRVAAGAIAKKLLAQRGIVITGHVTQIGSVVAHSYDPAEIERNPVRCADAAAAQKMVEAITAVKAEGDSLGGIIEIRAAGVPAGQGEPVFDKLEAELAKGLMSIGAVKGFEMGSGFASAALKGSQSNDQFRVNPDSGQVETITNNSGGTLGGISNGAELIMRIAIKPTSSINKEQQTVNTRGEEVKIKIEGRHDPCICPRIVPVAEAMVALVLIDMLLLQERIVADPGAVRQEKLTLIDHHILLLLAERQALIERGADLSADYRTAWLEAAAALGLENAAVVFDALFESR